MIKFGTGGWRAIIADEFTKENIKRLAMALALKMQEEGVKEDGVCIGYDRRFLSKETVVWVCEVLAAEGIPCYFVNRSSPTPLIMYYTMVHELPYGLMVTASHNPAVYNGIKVFTRGGRDADELQTQEIEGYLEIVEQEYGDSANLPYMSYEKAVQEGIVKEFNPLNEYLDNIISLVDMETIKNRGLRVALDPMYGVSQTALRALLATARCEVEMIHERHDTLFGGKLPSPCADTLKSLQNYVLDRRCDIGIATDGDADRIGVIDDKGRFLHPNEILVLLYYYLLHYRGWRGSAVRNVATTHRLDLVAESCGETCYEVPVGFKHISAKMQETAAVIGGESSGGLTVRGHIHGKDGVYAAMLLVEMIAVTGKKISEISKEMEEFYGSTYMEERDYQLSDEQKELVYERLMMEKLLPDFPLEIQRVSYLDGCKVYFRNGGWIIARFSGTEPLLRIFCEMETEKEAKHFCKIFEDFIQNQE